MKVTDTISVNPGKTALGHVESSAASIFRSPVLGVKENHVSADLVKVLFPTMKGGLSEFSKYDVPVRTLFATILIVSGLSVFSAGTLSMSISMAVCTLCFGVFLALGLFTRPVMMGAAVYYCILGALTIRSGSPDMTIFSLMFGVLIFGIIGSGKYSCDTLIRRAIVTHRKNTERKRKEDCLGYKAFHKMML